MIEQWKDIIGFEKLYQISNLVVILEDCEHFIGVFALHVGIFYNITRYWCCLCPEYRFARLYNNVVRVLHEKTVDFPYPVDAPVKIVYVQAHETA